MNDAWEINLQWPVAQHPLNRGLVSWFLSLPHSGWRGNTWRDLCRRNDAAFSTTANKIPVQHGPHGRRGGWGSVSFDETSGVDYCTLPAQLNLGSSTQTVSAWYRMTTGTDGVIVGDNNGPDFGGVSWLQITSTTSIHFEADGWNSNFSVSGVESNTGVWQWVCVVRSDTALTLYFSKANGLSTATTTVGSGRKFAVRYIGNDDTSTFDGMNGQLDSIRLCNRALSSGEVAALYAEECQGYPTLLNRFSNSRWTQQAAASGFTNIVRRGAQTLAVGPRLAF